MEFREVVRRRHMVRRYQDRPVDPAVVDRALAHAVRAPNAGFAQGWAFLRLDRAADVRRFWESTAEDLDRPSRWLAGMTTAPVVLVPLADRSAYLDRYAEPDKGWTDRDPERWAVPYWWVDTGMASLLLLQTAVDEGLAACFFGIPPHRVPTFRRAFGVPDHLAPVGAVTIGHPATDEGPRGSGSPARRARRPLEDVVHVGRWGPGDGR